MQRQQSFHLIYSFFFNNLENIPEMVKIVTHSVRIIIQCNDTIQFHVYSNFSATTYVSVAWAALNQ